jgi:hypothetical protein
MVRWWIVGNGGVIQGCGKGMRELTRHYVQSESSVFIKQHLDLSLWLSFLSSTQLAMADRHNNKRQGETTSKEFCREVPFFSSLHNKWHSKIK